MALDLRSPTIVKLLKYSTASFVGLVVGQSVLFLFYESLGWAAIPANLVSVTAGAIPNYLINRRWTWHQSGKNRLWGEVVPFWVMSALGMILSLFAVAYAEDRWDTALAVGLAQLIGFGVLWIAKFVILDKVMWKIVHDLQPDVAIDEGGAPPTRCAATAAASPAPPRAPGPRHRPPSAPERALTPFPRGPGHGSDRDGDEGGGVRVGQGVRVQPCVVP